MTTPQQTHRADHLANAGAIAGMTAGAVMAMFAMIAAVTYQHRGFFTPLFHISALVGSPKSMMTSVAAAMTGNRFWFEAGPVLVGLIIHMVTGGAYGMMFAIGTRRVPRHALRPAGAAFGLAAFAVSSFIALPLAAHLTGAGATISDMAKSVGWTTFAIEHLIFGVVLAGVALRWTDSDTTIEEPSRVGSIAVSSRR